MKKIALILMILTVSSKIIGLFRDIILAYFYGASNVSDAYLISMTIPMVLVAFMWTGISKSYIPVYSTAEKEDSTRIADRMTNNVISFMLIICTCIILITQVYTKPIIKLFALGFEGETLQLTEVFTRISIFSIYFLGLILIFNSYLHLKNNFIIPALTGIPFNIVTISAIVLSYQFNNIFLAIGSVIAVAFQLIILILFAYRKGYKFGLVLDRHDKYVKKIFYLSMPMILGASVGHINTLVDKTIASQIAIGGISALNYAFRLNVFVQGIFVMSIATVIYPAISKMVVEGNMMGLKKTVSQAIVGINLLVTPATIGAMIFAEPIVRFLFGRGAFDTQAISMTSYALFFYAIGMIGFGLKEVFISIFYSLQETKKPMINASIAVIINIVLNIILSKFLGIGGLALATSISAILCTILLFISLRKRIGSFGMKAIVISFAKILLASLFMGIIAKLSFNYLTTNRLSQNVSLFIAIVLGAITYFTIIYYMKIEEVDVIVREIKAKFRKTDKIFK